MIRRILILWMLILVSAILWCLEVTAEACFTSGGSFSDGIRSMSVIYLVGRFGMIFGIMTVGAAIAFLSGGRGQAADSGLSEKVRLEGEVQERRRIAEGLHDQVGQSLAAISLNLQLLNAAPLTEAQGDSLEESLSLVKDIGQKIRTLTFDLYPSSLREKGLTAAMASLVEQFRETSSAEIHFEGDRESEPSDPNVSRVVYRSVRELLRNATRHAEAGHIHITMKKSGPRLEVCVEDDGRGFDVGQALSPGNDAGRFGLFSIREEMALLGGKLMIHSQRGSGSRFTLVIPLNPFENKE